MISSKFKVAIAIILVLIIGCRLDKTAIKATPEKISDLYCATNLPLTAENKQDLWFEETVQITNTRPLTFYPDSDKETKGIQIKALHLSNIYSNIPISFIIGVHGQEEKLALAKQFKKGDFVKIKATIMPDFSNLNVIRNINNTCEFILHNPTLSKPDETDLTNLYQKLMAQKAQMLEQEQYKTTIAKVCNKARNIHYADDKNPHYEMYYRNVTEWIEATGSVVDTEEMEDGITKPILGTKVTTTNIIVAEVDSNPKNLLYNVTYDDNNAKKMLEEQTTSMYYAPYETQKISSKGFIFRVDIDRKENCYVVLDNPQMKIIKNLKSND